MLPLPPFVSVVDVCHATGQSYSRVYRDVLEGRIPAERHGSRWFVTRATFDALVRASPEARVAERAALSKAG